MLIAALILLSLALSLAAAMLWLVLTPAANTHDENPSTQWPLN